MHPLQWDIQAGVAPPEECVHSCRKNGVCVYLLRSSAARKKVSIIIPMEGDVEDVGITVEGLLCAIAMMNVLRYRPERQGQWKAPIQTARIHLDVSTFYAFIFFTCIKRIMICSPLNIPMSSDCFTFMKMQKDMARVCSFLSFYLNSSCSANRRSIISLRQTWCQQFCGNLKFSFRPLFFLTL